MEIYAATCIMDELETDKMIVREWAGYIEFLVATDGDNDISVWLSRSMAKELAQALLSNIGESNNA